MKIEDAMKIKNADIATHLKLPPVKLHCSMLAEDAIQSALKDYHKKKESSK
jgi:NifU-like protein involved in Fe-S cluster formation